jgi:hypothetical protein
MRFFSFLTSPIQTLDREWHHRQRDLDAAFARGRKERWARATLNNK